MHQSIYTSRIFICPGLIFHLVLFCFFPLHGQQINFKKFELPTEVSFRGLSVVNDSVAWVAGNRGTVCFSRDGGQNFSCKTISGYDSSDFRTVFAFDAMTCLVANTGSPGKILKTVDGGNTWNVVYENNHPEMFLDGMDFWNEKEGICYGDPVNGKMMVLRTSDGGDTWRELLGDSKPLLVDGEASFAASGTGIRCYDSTRVIMATGGAISRLLVSENRGASWKTIVTPIVQGTPSTGIFSFDFKNENEGVIVGGDFKNDTLSSGHVFYTPDGGKTWHFPEKPTRGYRECVQYLPPATYLAVGPKGIDMSFDNGENWFPVSSLTGLHVIRKARNGNRLIVVGAGGTALVSEVQ